MVQNFHDYKSYSNDYPHGPQASASGKDSIKNRTKTHKQTNKKQKRGDLSIDMVDYHTIMSLIISCSKFIIFRQGVSVTDGGPQGYSVTHGGKLPLATHLHLCLGRMMGNRCLLALLALCIQLVDMIQQNTSPGHPEE